MWFLRQDPGWSNLIFARGQIILEKGQTKLKGKQKFWGQKVLFGTKFLKFGPKRANLATCITLPYHAATKITCA